MSYTPGKIYADPTSTSGWVDIRTTGDDGLRSLPFIACKHYDAEANARRVVACWNACEGISTEALEKENMLPAFDREQDRADRAERQRDDLLESLEAIINDGIHCDVVPHLHTKAMEAIKKARGEA